MAASLEGNKLFAAILTAGVIGVGSGVLSNILYHPHELEEPVYKVAAPAEGGGGAAPAAEAKPIAELLTTASAEKGLAVAKKCTSCHDFNKGGPNKVGPNLWGVLGRDIAGHGGFSFSEALAGKEGAWDYESLNAFLTNPKGYAPGTKMAFAGISKDVERADLLAYLRTLSDQPPPLPGS